MNSAACLQGPRVEYNQRWDELCMGKKRYNGTNKKKHPNKI